MEQNKEIIRGFFEAGNKPTQENYSDTFDSFWHKDETILMENGERLLSSKSLLTTSGKVYFKPNLNWLTNADNNYGPNSPYVTNDCGDSDNPSYGWNHKGHVIFSGYKVNKVIVIAHSNSDELVDVRFQFVKRIRNTVGDWQGVRSDSEFDNTVLYDDLWISNTNDLYNSTSSNKAKRVFEMDSVNNNNVFNEDGEFFMYLKPIGTLTENRYFQFSLVIELEQI